MEQADTRVLTVVGFVGREQSGRRHMGKMLWRTHGFFPLAFTGRPVSHLEEELLAHATYHKHHRFVVTDVETFEQAAKIHELGGLLIWLRGRGVESEETPDPIECDYVVDNSINRNALADEEVRQILMSWLVSNCNNE